MPTSLTSIGWSSSHHWLQNPTLKWLTCPAEVVAVVLPQCPSCRVHQVHLAPLAPVINSRLKKRRLILLAGMLKKWYLWSIYIIWQTELGSGIPSEYSNFWPTYEDPISLPESYLLGAQVGWCQWIFTPNNPSNVQIRLHAVSQLFGRRWLRWTRLWRCPKLHEIHKWHWLCPLI